MQREATYDGECFRVRACQAAGASGERARRPPRGGSPVEVEVTGKREWEDVKAELATDLD